MQSLALDVQSGDRRALARAISIVERGGPEGSALGAETDRALGAETYGALDAQTDTALGAQTDTALGAQTDTALGAQTENPLGRPVVGTHVIGITGPPGGGKSTLVDALIDDRRAHGQRVAVVAVDPSSLTTGGAVLGDRVRMNQHSTDPDVFIRSIATRGHLGGVTAATFDVVDLCALAGWPTVIIETVGVGQSEIEIARIADTTIVVANPGMGDAVQARKAGLFEIGDVFVLNKADRPGASQAARELREMLHGRGDGLVPVLETVASQYADGGRVGVTELNEWLDERWQRLVRGDELARLRAHRSIARVDSLVAVAAERAHAAALASSDARGVRDLVEAGQLGVHAAAEVIAGLFLAQPDR